MSRRKPHVDRVGEVQGFFTVIRYSHDSKWVCECVCGKRKTIKWDQLKSGDIKSCGCRKYYGRKASSKPRADIAGKRYGRLIPVEYVGKSRWECNCDCGTKTVALTSDLFNGHKQSCGCLLAEVRGASNRKYSKEEAGLHILYQRYKRNAKNRGVAFKLSLKLFRALTKKNCYYCGLPPGQVSQPSKFSDPYWHNGLDRVNNDVGYLATNVAPCCKRCNRAKHSMSQDEFLGWIRQILQHHKGFTNI